MNPNVNASPEGAKGPPGQVVIHCHNLVKVYGQGENAVHALRGVSFSIEKGENVAIVGPSGSGKSTLLQILGCLDVASGGDYRLAGQAVTDLDDDALSELRGKLIGFVFQGFHLFPRLTLLDNVALPLLYQGLGVTERKERALAAIEAVRLGHRAHHLPNEMSGGEKQRGAIARAIVTNPAVILADEPTGNLDSVVKGEILDHLCALNASLGVTIVTVTHDGPTAERARRLVHFRDGNIVEDKVQ